jgi:hypothetical protein
MISSGKLNILVVDDESNVEKIVKRQADWQGRLRFINMKHYSDVIDHLVSDKMVAPAVFLVDIDLYRTLKASELKKNWGQPKGSALAPYGPLLVLPFLAPGRPAVFVPYSSHWGRPELLENGFVLLSMSLFQTITTGERWMMDRVERAVHAMNKYANEDEDEDIPWEQQVIEDYEPDYMPRVTEFESAIKYSLPKYREMLAGWPTLTISGLDAALEAIESLAGGVEHLETATGPIGITLRFGEEPPEVLSVESLFADIVRNRIRWSTVRLQALKNEFNNFIEKCDVGGRLQEAPQAHELEDIRVALVEQEGLHLHHGREAFRSAFNELYTEKHGKAPPRYWAIQCMRLTILRAFLEAWATVRADQNNGNRGVARLQNWRPERGEQREITESVCRLLGLTDENAARAGKRNNTPTLLHLSRLIQMGWWGEDLGLWQKPFCPSASQAKLFDLSSMDNDIELRPADRHFLKDCAIALELGDDLPDWVDG